MSRKKIALIILLALLTSFIFTALQMFDFSIVVKIIVIFIFLSIILYAFTKYIFQESEKNFTEKVYQKLEKLLPKNKINPKQKKSLNDLYQYIDEIENERQKEKEHYKNLDSYRKEYLGNVSHELKTPLFNVQGYISTLLDGAKDEPEILNEYLLKADKNIERMLNIIDDLETISQLESGAMILDYENFDIISVINEVFEQMELSAKSKNIKLILESNKSHYLVNADKFRIRQVLINLISNSIKYGKENGITKVTLQNDNQKIIVSVADNGIGIEEKHLPRIFERFYRVDKGRSREQGGTGLGLAIVKHIIEAHKQTISVQSKIGEGTTFTFTLDEA
ncbi:MAG TPA: ATP-binding protein [Bacteroidia bacterium]|nr:ATP-binding protein [Bacteroidia bacterium]